MCFLIKYFIKLSTFLQNVLSNDMLYNIDNILQNVLSSQILYNIINIST